MEKVSLYSKHHPGISPDSIRFHSSLIFADGRANQSLVLKTQWQGWRDRNTEDKLATLEQHRALMQEAVAITFENRKEEARVMSLNADDITIATKLLSELQKQQESECKGLLNFVDKVNQARIFMFMSCLQQ